MSIIGLAIPTYNEKENIINLLDSIINNLAINHQHNYIILVIDDNSPDKTASYVEEKIAHFNSEFISLHILNREKKEGLGKAYIAGFTELLNLGVEYIIQMDADFSHDPKYLANFINNLEKYDLIVGSRYVKDGGLDKDWPLIRKLVSTLGNVFARVVLATQIKDLTGGFNCYSSALLKKINYTGIASSGYGFIIELKYKAYITARSYLEFPIVFKDRQAGTSKIPLNTIYKNLLLCFKLRLNK